MFVLSSLHSHMKIHTGFKPHSCEICGMSFPITSMLKKHLNVHSDEKQHHCKVCEKGFKRKETLNKHMLTHEVDGGYRLSCDKCSKKFCNLNTLRLHLHNHRMNPYLLVLEDKINSKRKRKVVSSGFSCCNCKKSFKSRIQLKYHRNKCTECFKCFHCDRLLKSKSALSYHIEAHFNAYFKTFTCGLCSHTFTTRFSLLNHLQLCVKTGTKTANSVNIGNDKEEKEINHDTSKEDSCDLENTSRIYD